MCHNEEFCYFLFLYSNIYIFRNVLIFRCFIKETKEQLISIANVPDGSNCKCAGNDAPAMK